MREFSWLLIICGVCYLLMFGVEYGKVVRSQNWPTMNAEIVDAINGIPLTKFNQVRHEFAALVNWSYIKYSFKIGEHYYEVTNELGPHISVFDWIVGSMKDRFKPKTFIPIHYNPNNPKETTVGFEVFRPEIMLPGSGFILLALGIIGLYFNNVVYGTGRGDDDELNKPLEYFLEKKKKEQKERDQRMTL